VGQLSKAKQRGTAAETAVVNYLHSVGFESAERRTLSGANDKGDINLSEHLVIEVKDHQRMELAGWLDEANREATNANAPYGVVWHKRARKGSPADWYVTMDGANFVKLWKDLMDLVEVLERSAQLAKMVVGQ
jgi:hypothetical protein